MPAQRIFAVPPSVESHAPRTVAAPRTAVVALRALGSGLLVGAMAASALLALEFDFGVPRIFVGLAMGFLGFAFVSAGEGIVVLLWSVLRRIFARLRRPSVVEALRAVPPVPVGRILGVFVYVAGDVLWPQSFLKQIALPVVLEIGIVLVGLTFMAVAVARAKRRTRAARAAWLATPAVAILAFAWWVADPGFDGYVAAAPVGTSSVGTSPVGLVEDPGARGPFAVGTLTYGSGTSVRRPGYGAAADLLTTSVDGSTIFGGYGGPAGSFFRWYWGFGFDALPLNGLVWYPEDEGPHPLVLVVHGNHAMSTPSEPGYAYLGEHLASHGYVVASIDQNFLNGLVFFDGQFAEMPLRAWLLLQHLQQWRRWNATAGNPFTGRVDLDRVALVGHSRGGEAVAWAAHLNDHAMMPVSSVSRPSDFGFGIRAVVGIAPSDAYEGEAGRKPDLADASYLLLAGGHDADTFLLYGQAQYNRTRSDAATARINALAYLHRANHGQFNGVWGDRDRSLYNSLLLNRAPLLTQEAQQRAAKALVTSFLHASLRDEPGYRAPFRNPSTGSGWLPEGLVVTQFRDATSIVLEDFEGDGSSATPHARIESLLLRDGAREQGNRALRLTWEAGRWPTHAIDVSPEDAAAWAAMPRQSLTFALASVPGANPPTDVVIDLVAADGARAQLTLGGDGPLVPSLPAHLTKARWLYGLNGFPGQIRPEEIVLQTFTVPLAAFEPASPPFQADGLATVRFAFAGDGAGAVYLDAVALTVD
jgi:dienelactone hydrolase